MTLQLTTKEIMELLPHRYPFLYLDRVTEMIPSQYGVGIKNVTINECFFQGHFPENPILPGVVIIEALAQLTAIVNASFGLQSNKINFAEIKETARQRVGYLTKVNIKFLHVVNPGDQLLLFSEIGKKFGNIIQVKVKAMVNNQSPQGVAIGELFVSERKTKDEI